MCDNATIPLCLIRLTTGCQVHPLVLVDGLLVQLVAEQGFLNLSRYCVLLLREDSGFPVYRVARVRDMSCNRGEFRFSHARVTSVFFIRSLLVLTVSPT